MNMKAEKYIAAEVSKQVHLRAFRKILEDEELVYDYGTKKLPCWKTVVGNVCLAPDSEQSEAYKEVVTTCSLKNCEDHRNNETDISQEFQYLNIRNK